MSQNFITLARSELYDLVWSKPVREVAAQFGISDVALAKRCRALKIPLPARGYWARVAAGQHPRRPPLPPFTDRKRAVLPSYATTRAADGTVASEPVVTFEPNRTRGTTTVLNVDLPSVITPPCHTLQDCSSLVKRTARHHKHPRRAELSFARGETTGPILHLAVSPELLDRALLFADTLLRAAADQGWTPIPPREPDPPDPRRYYGREPEPKPDPGPHYADLDVDGQRIEFLIEERFELRELPPTAADLAKQKRDSWFRPEKRYDKIWSGHLRLKRPGHRYPYGVDGKSWFDTGSRRVESLTPRILADFRAVAARMHEVDEEREREQLAYEEAERQRQDVAARRAANQELIHELECQAGAWHRAEFLRRYLRAARRAVGPDGTWTVDLQGQSTDFFAWAEHYVNQLDPLHPEPRDEDLHHQRDPYYGAEEKRCKEELERFLGHTWEATHKLAP